MLSHYGSIIWQYCQSQTLKDATIHDMLNNALEDHLHSVS